MANIDFQYQLTPKGQELAREVSNETVKTTKKMMQKFDGDTINNFINGKSKSPQNKEYASSKTKNVKSKNNTASKIKPLPQGADMIDMLNKIHTFLQRNGEQDKLHQDRLNNYMEENLAEAKARHDKLLEAIKKLTKDVGYGKEMPTATKDVPPEQEKSILDYILDAFGLGKDVKDVFNIVKEIVKVARGSPLAGGMAIAALAGAIVGYVLPWVRNRDKELNPEKIYWFEPNPKLLEQLKSNVTNQSFESLVFPYAVSNKKGTAEFNIIENIVRYTHLNDKFPQFQNIIITNIRSNQAYAYNDQLNKFILCDKNDLLEDMIITTIG
jgi:hypothetical protein